jgi:hypothetical protein
MYTPSDHAELLDSSIKRAAAARNADYGIAPLRNKGRCLRELARICTLLRSCSFSNQSVHLSQIRSESASPGGYSIGASFQSSNTRIRMYGVVRAQMLEPSDLAVNAFASPEELAIKDLQLNAKRGPGADRPKFAASNRYHRYFHTSGHTAEIVIFCTVGRTPRKSIAGEMFEEERLQETI